MPLEFDRKLCYGKQKMSKDSEELFVGRGVQHLGDKGDPEYEKDPTACMDFGIKYYFLFLRNHELGAFTLFGVSK